MGMKKPTGTEARSTSAGRRIRKTSDPEGKRALEEIIAHARRLVFFGGAGVSTASGIPDFRSAEGLYAREFEGLDAEMILSRSFFYLHPEAFFRFYRQYMLHPGAEPNAAHRRLYDLEKEDKLKAVVTQNIDGLHKAAGNKRVFEIHGTVHENRCMDCGKNYPMEKVLHSEGIPRCDQCGGVVKPGIVLYGEAPDKYVCIGARREISQADTLIVAGTSLTVEPAASFLESFAGKSLVVINRTPTPADRRACLVLRGGVEEALAESP